MQDYNYNFELRTLLTHFAAAFNDVRIKRFDGQKFEKETIKVPLTYAPKSHILNDIIGLTDTIRLPIIAIEISSQSRDNERIKNKIDDLVYKNSDGNFVNSTAIPWNLSLTMTILAKYQEDVDQIIQNFAVNNNPYAIISWQEPKSGRELRTEILWDGSISLEYPGKQQTAKDPPYRITATTNFTVKGWLFKTSLTNNKPICRIDTDYVFTDKFYCDYSDLIQLSLSSTTESYTITGRPVLRYVSPYYIVQGKTPDISLQGYSLNSVHGIFLSGSNPSIYPLTEYKPFSGMDSLFGYPVNEFNKSDNTITFSLPAASGDGFVDIIAVNSCGYGKLTEDSNRCGRVENPYPVSSPEHYSWTVLQFPYMNGLIMADYFDPFSIDYSDMTYVYSDVSEPDKNAIITKIKELMTLGNISLTDLE